MSEVILLLEVLKMVAERCKLMSTMATNKEYEELVNDVIPYLWNRHIIRKPSVYCFLIYASNMVMSNVRQRRERLIRERNGDSRIKTTGITNSNTTNAFENRPKPGFSTTEQFGGRSDFRTIDPREENQS